MLKTGFPLADAASTVINTLHVPDPIESLTKLMKTMKTGRRIPVTADLSSS